MRVLVDLLRGRARVDDLVVGLRVREARRVGRRASTPASMAPASCLSTAIVAARGREQPSAERESQRFITAPRRSRCGRCRSRTACDAEHVAQLDVSTRLSYLHVQLSAGVIERQRPALERARARCIAQSGTRPTAAIDRDHVEVRRGRDRLAGDQVDHVARVGVDRDCRRRRRVHPDRRRPHRVVAVAHVLLVARRRRRVRVVRGVLALRAERERRSACRAGRRRPRRRGCRSPSPGCVEPLQVADDHRRAIATHALPLVGGHARCSRPTRAACSW